MATSSWPFHDGSDGTPVLEDQWSIMARQWAASGVVGAPGDANLQVYANSSGREVHVKTGRVCVRGHWLDLDAEETLAVSANSSGNPRIDRVVARLDPSADAVALDVLAGTPAGSPVAPDLTQTDVGVFELPLALVAVASGAASITAGNVTDDRYFTSVPHTPALSTRRPANPVIGQRIFEVDTGAEVVYSGTQWVRTVPLIDHWESWRIATVPGLSGSDWQNVTYNTARQTGGFSYSAGSVAVPSSGLYLIEGRAMLEGSGFLLALANDSEHFVRHTATDGGYYSVSACRYLGSGENVKMQIRRASAGPVVSDVFLTVTRIGQASLGSSTAL